MSDVYDSPWKEMLELYFPDFMAFFFPQAHAEIDWSRGYESCDQELRQIVRDAELGTRLADKLMKVWRKGGGEQYVFTHVEVQGQREVDFPLRMYTYNYRLFDRCGRPVVSLAILADDSTGWRPDSFGYELWGCRVSLRFPVVKLKDYNDRRAELEASDNPFAIVVMAHLEAQATRRDPQGRLLGAIRLVRHLYAGGYQRQEVLELLRFLDWVLKLPPELETRLNQEIEHYESEMTMRYVTTWERRGIEKGLEQGLEQGLLQGEATVLRRLLRRRFTQLPDWVDERLEQAKREDLESWADRVIDAEALEDVFLPDER